MKLKKKPVKDWTRADRVRYCDAALDKDLECEHGHFGCAAWKGGPCSNEVDPGDPWAALDPTLVRLIRSDARYYCNECEKACVGVLGWFDKRASEARKSLGVQRAKRVVKNTSTYSYGRRESAWSHPLKTEDPISNQRQGPSIFCQTCAQKQVDAAAAERAKEIEKEKAETLAAARKAYPNADAVRKAARRAGIRHVASNSGDWTPSVPGTVRLVDQADVWDEEVERAIADALAVLKNAFPEELG